MQASDKKLMDTITHAIQEKKGRNIVIADLSGIEGAICKYFVICQGGSAHQVDAIAGEVSDYTREQTGQKAIGVSGLENCIWVALDYGDAIVHIFHPEARDFYDLEHLWADAKLTALPNID